MPKEHSLALLHYRFPANEMRAEDVHKIHVVRKAAPESNAVAGTPSGAQRLGEKLGLSANIVIH